MSLQRLGHWIWLFHLECHICEWPFAQTSWNAYVCVLDISHSRFKQIKVNLVCLFKSYAPYFAMQASCFRKQELI
jgi:hypothetical protein